MDRYFQYKAAQAIGDLAKGGGGTGADGGTDIGSAATAGLAGRRRRPGHDDPGMLQQAMAGGAQPKIRCPNCSSDVPFGSKFCPNCGTNIGPRSPVRSARRLCRPAASSAPTAATI